MTSDSIDELYDRLFQRIMASKSKKSEITKTPAVSQAMDDVEEDEFDEAYIVRLLCKKYLYGIKASKIWETPSLLDRTKSTYFILPETPIDYRTIGNYVSSFGKVKPTARDFEKFWFELSDIFKERYLLAFYMAIYDKDIRPAEDECKDLWIENNSQISQLLRGYVMEKNKNKFRHGGALSLFVNGLSIGEILSPRVELMKVSIFERMTMEAAQKAWWLIPTFMHMDKWLHLLALSFSGFVRTYFIWVSYDAQNLRRYADALIGAGVPIARPSGGESRLTERIEFMRKLNLAAPRWSQTDRRMMLDAIETDGNSCRGTYVQILLNEVGVEKFKKLVFGKHRFCAHCHRSSYTGEDRLLACKRCDTEGVRPRAWYCDRQCQKADWRHHRASKHPPMVFVEEKAGKKKKKRKPRKK